MSESELELELKILQRIEIRGSDFEAFISWKFFVVRGNSQFSSLKFAFAIFNHFIAFL